MAEDEEGWEVGAPRRGRARRWAEAAAVVAALAVLGGVLGHVLGEVLVFAVGGCR